jgi:ketosteroid isomerase-like protein
LPAAPADVVVDSLSAFSAADFERMRRLLAEDLVAYVTDADGGTDRIEGREAYLGRIEAMDLPAVDSASS